MLVGTADDTVRQPTLVAAKAKMAQLHLAGFNAVRVTEVWTPGQTAPPATDIAVLQNVTGAAQLYAMEVFVAVFNAGSKTTPLSAQDQADFASFTAALVSQVPGVADVIVGNEPNTNRFWLPQFNADGTDAAARRIERVLTSDPGMGVLRHVDAGYSEAVEVARARGVKVPGITR